MTLWSAVASAEKQAEAYRRHAAYLGSLLARTGGRSRPIYELLVSATETAQKFQQIADGYRDDI
jgi:hypothetical protein